MFNRMCGLSVGLATLLAGCALPNGPAVMVLPGSSKNFAQFRADDTQCRQFAYVQIGGETPSQAATAAGVGTAVAGGALGAAAGAAIGGGSGAAIGAGTGLAVGGVAGAGAASNAGQSNQERYDMFYIQCMYAQGHKVPVYGRFTGMKPGAPRLAPEGKLPAPPPPPQGTPPPPPSR